MQATMPGPRVAPRHAVTAMFAGAGLLAFASQRAESLGHFLMMAGFGGLLIALASIDAATLRLPNRLVYPGLVAALLLAGAWPDHSWLSSLAGGAAGGLIMLVLFAVLPGFGAGDVKLCALIGLLIGWPHVLTALVVGIIANGLLALVGLATRKLALKGAMPYGPGLIAGALLMLLLAR